MKISVIISFLIISSFENSSAQNSYVKLGQQALMDGDFKVAVAQLEKACLIDSTNSTCLCLAIPTIIAKTTKNQLQLILKK
jgi:Tfp pilus assembly protein PilF